MSEIQKKEAKQEPKKKQAPLPFDEKLDTTKNTFVRSGSAFLNNNGSWAETEKWVKNINTYGEVIDGLIEDLKKLHEPTIKFFIAKGWESKPVEEPWYNDRFLFFEKKAGGSIYHKRITREWFKEREDEIEQIMTLLGELEKEPRFMKLYPHGRADFHPLYWLLRESNGS